MSNWTGTAHKLTRQQQKSLHKYFELLARELNNSGITIQKFITYSIELNWTKNSVKEIIWRPLQEHITGKKSTTELDKITEIDEIFDTINKHIGTTWGLYVPFPSKGDDIAPMINE